MHYVRKMLMFSGFYTSSLSFKNWVLNIVNKYSQLIYIPDLHEEFHPMMLIWEGLDNWNTIFEFICTLLC